MATRTSLGGVRGADVALTAALLVPSLAQVWWIQPVGTALVGLVFTLGTVLPLAWRRSHPVGAALAGTAPWLIPTESYLFLGYVVAVLLFFSLGRRTDRPLVGPLICAWAIAAGAVGTLLRPEDPTAGLLSTPLVVGASYVAGQVMRSQETQAQVRLDEERAAARRAAVEEERTRIVRELHDVVGHEVTLMAIQSEAAVQALAVAPERVAEPVAAVRETAQRAGRELRAILDILGHDELPVVPDARGLRELTERAARLGIPNELSTSGEAWPDAPSHWLAVNRIVQECLTNCGRHAPGETATVCLRWSHESVDLEIANRSVATTEPAPWGRGLTGLAERARLVGGSLSAGADDGRFVVRAHLPASGAVR